ncbi:MAG: hypothetical protein TR69_WS6001000495 [candidate division WS6 bacterium OLB20]|uniref:Uncharacterized protein n=1 Tax=candidate division WS6 bacterium OLB20 TaxID=1617426 RepID=A0A136LXW4_9BACT|nr:MAG: hypothetical protein TR69_WS6001000495 [candidate division WS6 bacterium OLB20]
MKAGKQQELLHTRSIALGLVFGLTMTAVIVTIQSFIGLSDIRIAAAYNLADLRSIFQINQAEEEMKQNGSDGLISYEEVSSQTTVDWETYTNEEYGFALRHPGYSAGESGLLDCRQEGVASDCFTAVFTDGGTEVTVSTDANLMSQSEATRFPVVSFIGGEEIIASQFRRSSCQRTSDGQICTPDKHAEILYTQYTLNNGLSLFVTGEPTPETSAVVNSIQTQ